MRTYQVHSDLSGGLYFLDGARTAAAEGARTFDVIEPSSGTRVARCGVAPKALVDRVCESARAAQRGWARTAPLERAKVLHRVAAIINASFCDTSEENVEALARWETRTNGKCISEAREDVRSSADTFTFYAGALPVVCRGETHELQDERFAYTRQEPFGVVGAIGAWNYPLQTCVWKVAPALAAGNSVVYKPSPMAPGSPVALGEIFAAAGLPAGVFNVVQGEGGTGEALCNNEHVRKLTFTGSVETGKKIQQACAANNVKPCTLELGGKSAYLVFEDANLPSAISATILANFTNQGEVCTNATRVFVQQSILERFTAALLEALRAVRVGDPHSASTNVGAVIGAEHLQKLVGFVERAVKQGAKVLRGGKALKPAGVEGGFYFDPAVLTNLNDTMEIVREETFGPICLLLPFATESEAIERANRTHFGLAAGLHTRANGCGNHRTIFAFSCLKRAHRVAAALEAGTVFCNTYNDLQVHVPFGGYKDSGHGRENSVECLRSFMQTKSIYVNYGDNVPSNLA